MLGRCTIAGPQKIQRLVNEDDGEFGVLLSVIGTLGQADKMQQVPPQRRPARAPQQRQGVGLWQLPTLSQQRDEDFKTMSGLVQLMGRRQGSR
jgi:hypothetical protein